MDGTLYVVYIGTHLKTRDSRTCSPGSGNSLSWRRTEPSVCPSLLRFRFFPCTPDRWGFRRGACARPWSAWGNTGRSEEWWPIFRCFPSTRIRTSVWCWSVLRSHRWIFYPSRIAVETPTRTRTRPYNLDSVDGIYRSAFKIVERTVYEETTRAQTLLCAAFVWRTTWRDNKKKRTRRVGKTDRNRNNVQDCVIEF